MKFFTNKIANPAGNGVNFQEWIEKTFGTKTASEAKPGIGMDTDGEPRGQQRGQVINNDNEEGAHSYQEGESVDGKKDQGGNSRPDSGGTTDLKDHKQNDKEGSVKEAVCGKEMGESSDAGKVTEDHTEAGPGDDKHPEPKVLINNDPCYQKGESTDPGKVRGKNKKQPGEPVVSASNKLAFKKVSTLNHQEKLALFMVLSAQKHPIEYCESMTSLKFANLTPKEKQWFTNFWEILFPPEYAADMVADR